MKFHPAVARPPDRDREGWWFLFHGDRLLVETRGETAGIPFFADPADRGIVPVRTQYLGTLDGLACCAGEIEDPAVPDGAALRSLRSLLGILPEERFVLAGRAFQIVDWERTHRFCGKCGMPTVPVEGERAKACARCGIQFYPRVAPAVIVAVVRDGKILLARSRRSSAVFYSVLAGFVEAGETFEECVRREIREEVGIEVAGLRYFGSQPWPFPHNLMVGFTADYAGGDLVLEEKEIAQAGWFDAREVPRLQIPRRGTIARELIDWFLANPAGAGRGGK